MALSFVEHIGDGSTTTFSVPFPYLSQDDVKVAVSGAQRTYTWNSSQVINITPAPAGGAIVKVYRETPNTARLVDFEDDSIMDEDLLDQMNLQLFYIAQEAYDLSANAIVLVGDGNYDARSRRVKNVADPVEPTDAVNLKTFEGDFLPRLVAEAERAEDAADASQALKAGFDELFADLLYRSGLFDVSYAQINTWKQEVSNNRDLVAVDRLAVANDKVTVAADRATTTTAKNSILQDIATARTQLNTDIANAKANVDARTTAGVSTLDSKTTTTVSTIDARTAKFATDAAAAEARMATNLGLSEQSEAAAEDSARTASSKAADASADATKAVTARTAAEAARDAALGYKQAVEAVGTDAVSLANAVAQAEAAADRAEEAGAGSLTWDAVANKPATFPPAAHSHAWAAITDKPADYPAAFHTHGWADVTGKPTTYPPATHSHSYNDLTDKPALFSGAYSALTGVPTTFAPAAHSHAWVDITGKPTLFSGSYADLTNKPTTFTPAAHTHAWTEITGKPTSFASDWTTLANKPATYAPAAHSHAEYLPLTGGTTAGVIICSGAGMMRGNYGGVNRGQLYNDADGIGFLSTLGAWALRVGPGASDVYAAANFTATGNITAYSDIRLKTDIKVIPVALDKVRQLRGVTYTRKDTGERQTGVIAQEVQAVLPEAVNDSGEFLSVAYGNLVGLLIEAVKELAAEVEELKRGAA